MEGDGELVVLLPPAVTGPGLWQLHLQPALVAAGYRVLGVEYDALDLGGRSSIDDLIPALADGVADAAAREDPRPFRLVGASFGALVAQEVLIRSPGRVTAASLMGARCRTDFLRERWALAMAGRIRTGCPINPASAVASLLQLFSPVTLNDPGLAEEWLTLLEMAELGGVLAARQFEASVIPNRTDALRSVPARCLVVAFSDDILTPPALCQEVAAAIPAARYLEVERCGHFGFVERAELVAAEIISFLKADPGDHDRPAGVVPHSRYVRPSEVSQK